MSIEHLLSIGKKYFRTPFTRFRSYWPYHYVFWTSDFSTENVPQLCPTHCIWFWFQVRSQHLERNIQFLCNELKVVNKKEAEDRIFFVSSKETLHQRLTESGAATTPRKIPPSFYTLQGEYLHWNLNFAILLMTNLLNFNSAKSYIFKNLSMMAYITKIHKSKFATI